MAWNDAGRTSDSSPKAAFIVGDLPGAGRKADLYPPRMAALLLRRKGDHLVLLLVKRLSHNMLELAVMVEVEEDVKRDVVSCSLCRAWPPLNSACRSGQAVVCVNAGARVVFFFFDHVLQGRSRTVYNISREK